MNRGSRLRTRARVLWGLALLTLAAPLALPAAARRGASDSLTVLATEAPRSRRPLTEREWAAQLIRHLGIEDALGRAGAELSDAERFALLCADRAELTLESGGRRVPGGVPLRVAVPIADGGPGQSLRKIVEAPATALYLLSIEGVGAQRWSLDRRVVGHLDPSPLGIAQSDRVLPLRAGPHELAATLTPRARVDRAELIAQRSLCIAPADGWHPERLLTYGTLARTLVHASGLEGRLPEASAGIPIAGDRFVEASGGGERSRARFQNGPTGIEWARAAAGPAEFVYRVRLADPGLFTIQVRSPGGGQQLWSVDGRYRAALEFTGSARELFWAPLTTLPLASGEHVLRAFVSAGSGIDRIRLVPHEPRDADYIRVLAVEGVTEGAPDAVVPRGEALGSLRHPVLARASSDFLGPRKSLPSSELAREGSRRPRTPPAAPAPPPLEVEIWK